MNFVGREMKFRITMFCISAMFMVIACVQCYNLGYEVAKGHYEDQMVKMKDKHNDEVVEQIKKRVAAEARK